MNDSLHHVLDETTGKVACKNLLTVLAAVYEEVEFAKLARSGTRVCDECVAFLTGRIRRK